jgi:TatD DNase family protein
MWIDTHCHLDAAEFDDDRPAVAQTALAAGVRRIVIPAIAVENFAAVRDLAHSFDGGTYALGIHPLFVRHAAEEDLDRLREAARAALSDPRFVAIGEIGLDFFVKEIAEGAARERQERFYAEQLKIARDLDLPVLLHVRRSQDIVLKYLRRIDVASGIAHAFNGSFQQAEGFAARGFALGFGGAMTFTRAHQIRRLAVGMPLEHLVLETDSPDISPAWLHPTRNEPREVPRIGHCLAELRGLPPDEIAHATAANAARVLPRLAGVPP